MSRVERLILQAQQEGRFEDLAGAGRPIADIDEPYDPDWWVKAWARRENLRAALAERVRGGGRG